MILKRGVLLGNKYRIESHIATGGMGIVWRGRHVSEGYYVAVKEPRLDTSPETAVAKIRFEAGLLQQLRHVHIVNQYEAFEISRIPTTATVSLSLRPVVTVLEYADGGTLKDRARHLSDSEKIDVFLKIADAVSYIHSVGVVHRDIKPSNVLFAGNLPKLSDFGTAKYMWDSALEIVESPGGYTAPEQLRGHATAQSDIWSLGGLLFYLFTGKDPQVAMPHYPQLPSIPSVRSFNRDAPEEVELAVRLAMHPEPAMRVATVTALMDVLRGRRHDLLPRRPTLVVLGRELELPEGEIVIGRSVNRDELTWGRVGSGVLILFLPDPRRVISRQHAKIFQVGEKWYVKDLGSLNKTAVYRDGRWHLVYKARGVESPPFELRDGDKIAICYDERLGPYVEILVRLPQR